MLCNNCKIDIPPVWIHCINNNTCPQCGGKLYSDEQKQLLDELKAAMTQMQEATPEAIVGWLLSNYTLQKFGDAQPVKFHQTPTTQTEPKNQPVQDSVPEGLKIANNKVQDFLSRTNAYKSEKSREDLKNLVNEINKIKSGNRNEEESDGSDISIDDDGSEDYKPRESLAKNMLNNSVVMTPEGDEEPLTREELKSVAALVSASTEESTGVSAVLEQDRLEKLKRQRASLNGTGRGVVRRSS